ncbi:MULTISPECIES: alkaline phosphatase PhoD [Bacillus]|uniref:alkaline phosphatase PhoD n=1 Tax=Bacillus TaxID=1386 RepID=UPI0001CE3258|nr:MULTISPECIES: alkaline phosphatase PhoD [Bacillus]MDP4113439.1 alkaline phosphatase PhoD [Bacillota bacterium]HCJ7961676.1 alkaline phosphatase PhoD [Klebsiella pneumoniae]AKE22072.1 phosphodiesterase/alkaline phosphatase D [Bacillus sp. LM 4-2]AMK70920.1 alkaline phosphatase [Bacillus subtilis subsp. natto]AOS66446.1 alkaline phosphatase [Bacillus subtilis]
MAYDSRFDEWVQKLKEESFQNNTFDRRKFIQGAGKIAGLSLGLTIAQSVGAFEVNAAPKFSSYPFTLGVASGDPLSDSVVLWTRLAPDPLNGGGMPKQAVPVKWEVAKDEHFRKIVRKGTEMAKPSLAHSVHVEADGLEPNKVYYYRFKTGHELSPVGKTKTLPAPGANVPQMTFAFASCQQYEHGYYTAYKHMAKEKLDLVFHLGDYIYEYGPNEYVSKTGNVRTHNSAEIITLQDYRNRHAQYRSDANLKAAHAAFPWVVTWDDHEVENNYANKIPEKGQSVEAFVLRRAAAYQAYYEHMPLRISSLPNGPDMQLYRHFTYGNLASFNVLDTRQYRDDQANNDGNKPPSDESLNPNRTLLGKEQEQWLFNNLGSSTAHWNVLAQQIFFAKWNFGTSASPIYSMDSWDGYPAQRERVINFIKSKNLNNVVVLTGDVHASWASNLHVDFEKTSSKIFGAEFVGTSITSGGNGADKRADTDQILKENPHIKFFNDYRGYVRCTVTPHQWKADYRVMPFVTEPGAAISTRASFVYQKDQTGLRKVSSTTIQGGVKQSDEVEEDRFFAHNKAHEKQMIKKRAKITN